MVAGNGDREQLGPRGLVRRVGERPDTPAFSICTLVTRWAEYDGMRASFRAGGFDADCEYLVVDNAGANAADAFVGLNELLQAARADHIILCHQDVLLLEDDRRTLEARLADLDARDPAWGLCGNAGCDEDGRFALCISHPHSDRDRRGEPFPARVASLDENFIVVRRAANLSLSRDLGGFHHYGADLCIIADVLGWSAFVIDFFLRHNSGGTFDAAYEQSRLAIVAKYRRAFRSRWMHLVTDQPFYLSGSARSELLARLRRKARHLAGSYRKSRR